MLTHIRPADLPQWLAQHTAAAQALPVVLDVREPWEVQTASVSAQGFELRCLPMSSLAQRWQEIPTDRAIACLCHHGGRSAQVATFLQNQGYTQVVNIQGGIHQWSIEVDPGIARY